MTTNGPSKHDPESEAEDLAGDSTASGEGEGFPAPEGNPSLVEQTADDAPHDDDADEEPEFSLSQLSEAYAQVIEEQTGQRPVIDTPIGSSEPTEAVEEQETQPDQHENDNAGCAITPETIVEAILFVGAPQGVKLTSRKIAAVLRDVSPKEVTQIVKQLNQRYQ